MAKLKNALFLYGCSCAGKGEVGKKIKEDLGDSLCIIETGEYFRKHKELCKKAHNGLLVANHHVMEFFKEKISECDVENVILDSPRTHDQVVLLANFLAEIGLSKIAAAYVDTSIKVCRSRLEQRAHKEHRDDDKDMQAIETRLSTFLVESPFVVSALQQYTTGRLYFHINGDKSLGDMQREASVISEEVFGYVRELRTHKSPRFRSYPSAAFKASSRFKRRD